MKTLTFGMITVIAFAGLQGAAPPSLAKGKDNWLSEQAFKRAQGQDTGQYDNSPNVFPDQNFPGGFSSTDSLSTAPQIFTPGMQSGQPVIIAPGSGQDNFDPQITPQKSPDEGFTTYPVPNLVPLSNPALSEQTLSDSLASAIQQELRASASAVKTTAEERDAIIAYYQLKNFAPLWVTASGLTDRAKNVLDVLSHAEDEGLSSEDYLSPPLSALSQASSLTNDVTTLAKIDIGVTARALRYASDLHSGRIVPNKLSGYYDLDPPKLSLSEVLGELSSNASPAVYLASLAPSQPSYRRMKALLAQLRSRPDQTDEAKIPSGKLVKAGGGDDRIPAVRRKMVAEGFLSEDDALGWMIGHRSDGEQDFGRYEMTLDKALSQALKAFQRNHQIEPTGKLDEGTLEALNSTANESKKEKLVLNMERLRWMPHEWGARYVFVNESAFELQVVNGENVLWSTKVIVGKPDTQTFVFADQMETIVLNPYWGVPKSIIAHEMLPHLINDSTYLDRQGFEVVDASGQIVPSSSIDWWSYGDSVPFDVRQPPGNRNALGKIKFLFPNSHDIYMHDTPLKQLFKEPVRAFSHGCIRVENPRRLAEFALGLDGQRIDDMIAGGNTQEVKLGSPIPVYLAYFTAWPNSGEIAFYSDVYKRDQRLATALGRVEDSRK